MKFVQPISLDVFSQEQRVTINAKQGDTAARSLKITLTESGKPIKPEEGVTAYFRAKKRDQKSVVKTATVEEDGTITVDLIDQVFTCPGMVDADISLVKDGAIISSLSFRIDVEPALINNAWQSDDSFGMMLEATDAANKAADRANTAADEANATNKQVKTDEEARVKAEQARVAAEQKRESQESTRQSQEQARQTQESGRVEAEKKRVTAEEARASAETARSDAETARKSAEEARVAAEKERTSAETERKTAESGRVTAEAERVKNESQRQTDEAVRKSAETARDTAEKERASAETARKAAETARDTAEQTRKANEDARVKAEQARADAEEQRATETQGRLDAMDAATAKVDGLTVDAETIEAGLDADATLSTPDGHYYIHFSVPKGDQGPKGDPGEFTTEQLEAALATKQDTLTFDDAPTAESDNPVKSKGIKEAIDTAVTDVKTDVAGVKDDTEKIITILTETKSPLFGFSRDLNDSNPDTRIEYLYDAAGMTPAKMGAESFEYGSWSDIWFVRDNYACMLKPDGTEAYKLNPNDYSKKEDGTDSTYNAVGEDGLNCMAAFPTIWFKRYTKGGKEYIILCEHKYDDTFHAYAHTTASGRIAEHCYHAAFKGALQEDKLRSIAGLAPDNSRTAEAERTSAKANGEGWDLRPWSFQAMLMDMCTLISKTDNSQLAFGNGHITGGSKAADLLTTGTLYNRGQFWGDQANGAMKVFHVENFWGDRWDRLVGLVTQGNTWLAKMTPEGSGYNFIGVGYDAFSKGLQVSTPTGNASQSETYTSDLGTVPVKFTGSNTTYTCDWMWWNINQVDVVLAGGDCSDGARCGSRGLSADNAGSVANWFVGGSPFFLN